MSMIEGDGDGDVCDNGDEEVKEAKDDDVASDLDRTVDVNEGRGTRLVSKSSNGHQSNVVGGPNKNIVVSCLGTGGADATTHPTQTKIGRAMLPKHIAYGRWEDDDVGSEES